MKTWKIGIIGAGLIADFHARAVGDLEHAQVVAICDNGSGKADELAKKYQCEAFHDYKTLLEQPLDLIMIASPSGAHMEPAILAAEKGIHVLCEKPLDVTLERIDRMIEAHQNHGTRLGGIFNFRYDEVTPVIKKAIDEKRLGKITYAAVHVPWWREESYYQDSWHGTKKLDGGGALMNQSIHMVDLLGYLMGPLESLSAFKATSAHQIEAEDLATAIVKFRNGALGYIFGTTAAYPGQFRRLELMGTEGTIVQVDNSIAVWDFKNKEEGDEEILKKYGMVEGGGGVSNPGAIRHQNHTENLRAFIDAVESGKPFAIDGKEARKAVEIILSIYKSAEEGKIITF